MKRETRDPLIKESFLSGNRQKWTGILLIYGMIIAFLQIYFKIDPNPYIEFAITIGSLFILGGSVDSFMKIQSASKGKPKEPDYKEIN